ncbi:MAG: sigma-70 family RNA polymerase sigma factor [Gammaproteobacteria bacterium]|nr:sigma-70 family RNA polymerase sigma factor [Gammaproteobacteria bacterium]
MSHTLAEHFFRHSYGMLVAVLCRQFGPQHLELIEDSVQSALLEAMQCWRAGAPNNPAAWLKRVASNRMLDHFRHSKVAANASSMLEIPEIAEPPAPEVIADERGLDDEVLRLIFMVCHPALNRRAQIMMALKHLCGFSTDEIARGLLMNREAIKKQLQRTAQQLRELKPEFELPPESVLGERLDIVHHVLYMIFTEGHSSASAEQIIREDVCAEAARLTHLLATHALGNADTRALLALMMLHAARLPERMDQDGNTRLLEDQNRHLWDQSLIHQAGQWLRSALPGPDSAEFAEFAGRYQLEALIALLHGCAPSFEQTPWHDIVRCYDALLQQHNSPVYRVNRAIAVALSHGVENALSDLETIPHNAATYPGLACAHAWLLERAGRFNEALIICERVLEFALAPHERRLMMQQKSRLLAQVAQKH